MTRPRGIREVPDSGVVSHVWPVTQGLVSQAEMDALVKFHHRTRCSSFDGGANRVVGAGPMTVNDRIGHEATIASVMDAMRSIGLWGQGVPK